MEVWSVAIALFVGLSLAVEVADDSLRRRGLPRDERRTWLGPDGAHGPWLSLLPLVLLGFWVEGSALLFLGAFLLPDIPLWLALAGWRPGWTGYRVTHDLRLALGFTAVALPLWWLVGSVPLQLGLIWVTRIGFDRYLGYGMSFPSEAYLDALDEERRANRTRQL